MGGRCHLGGSGPGWGREVSVGGQVGAFAVDALVPHQVCLAAEALAALRAGEGTGSRVDGLVANQVGFGAETAGADGTGVGPTARVHCLVAAEVRLAAEEATALRASERPGAAVGPGMGD